MIHNSPDFGINTHKEIFNIEGTAQYLGISTATVRNWVKSGQLSAFYKNNKSFFYKADIESLKQKLISGELKKLNKRANKKQAQRFFIPKEYITNPSDFDKLNPIIDFVQKNHIPTTTALFLLGLNLLKKEKLFLKIDIKSLVKKQKFFFKSKVSINPQIKKEIHSWFLEVKNYNINTSFSFLLNCSLPDQRDILGILYQSLLHEGKKSQSGSYYTPYNIVKNIQTDYVKKDSKVLDPCCGTGQFLLGFSDVVDNPLNIYGMDYDQTAVRIARLNLLIKFKNHNFIPNIFCKNLLFDKENQQLDFLDSKKNQTNLFNVSNDKDIKDFDVIATNPPWGASFLKQEIKQLKQLYPEIRSAQSFSYFLKKSFSLLKPSGILSFLLPESILNVKTHKNIREFILKFSQIKKIIYLNRVFKNVFTPVIRLDLKKGLKNNNSTIIQNTNAKYKTKQIQWTSNHDFIFDIHSHPLDNQIINKVYQVKHTTLKNQAIWALGIVTGDNKKFIVSKDNTPAKSISAFEPIYRGKDLKKFIVSAKPYCYIQFQPDKFQQVAPEYKYRSKQKLIYKFISKDLTFAYDDKQRLTLNSANILIPQIPNYPIKVILALFNSSLYQFLFQKKFSSIKVLRSHIEALPLPLWDKKTFLKIIKLTNQVIKNQNKLQTLDDYITHKFKLTTKEITRIKNLK